MNAKELGQRMKFRREALDLRQEDVADALSMSRVNYTRIELGQITVSALDLQTIAGFFRVPASYFFDDHVNLAVDEDEREVIFYYRNTSPELKPSARAALKALHDIERAKGEGATSGKRAE